MVNKGDTINLDKNTYLKILFPENELISENALNNNSIVCKLYYNNFTMLFTGDIEESAEEKIVNLYESTKQLKSTILKIAHHGSKSSTTQNFLNEVKPQIALIGVGKLNTFGHPNKGVLERLTNIGAQIYRTDVNGEINIKVNKKGEIWVDKMIK